ncbi:MAG: alpha/beta fold hydrolase [Gammaproteobacteria bacterium]|nr:alpha/beta fold hydrolase [Gammaproteobacteria bacterium]
MTLSSLLGCARALAPMAVIPAQLLCGVDEDDCLRLGESQFTQYRQEKLTQIERTRGEPCLPCAPTAHLYPRRTEYSVLLVHGLNDSAYYMEDIAALLYRQGFNVLTILLPGHGTKTQDMLEVTAEQWRAEVGRGLEMASLVGRKLIVGGFSLGGALTIDAALRRTDIHGLLLFSPAIKLRSFNAVSSLSCTPGLRELSVETNLPPNPVKYKHRVGNGVCQLSRIIENNLNQGERQPDEAASFTVRLEDMARRLKVPTFVALTYADARISPQAVLDWSGQINSSVTLATFGQQDSAVAPRLPNGGKVIHINDENLPHSYLLRRTNPYNNQQNPYFDEMSRVLLGFLQRNFAATDAYSKTAM